MNFFLKIAIVFFFVSNQGLVYSNEKNFRPLAVTWEDELKELIFDEDEEILDGEHLITLKTPYRAADAAIVPISLDFKNKQDENNFVKKVTIIVDENPSPLVGQIHMTPKTGNPSFSTRIRIDRYTYVRAIAEMNDEKKYMVANYVKAAGGCSAPSLADMDTVMARLGKMKMKLIETGDIGQLNKAQFIISHPNFSGLQFNQLTRAEIPAHFVDSVKIVQDNETILNVSSDISLSEDPSFTFYYLNTGGELNVTVTDSMGGIYSNKWPIEQILSFK